MHACCSGMLVRPAQHVASVAHVPVGVPPPLLLVLLPLLDPLPPELDDVHWLWQLCSSHVMRFWVADWQPDSMAFCWQADDCSAEALKVPPGHSQLIASLQELSTPLSCDPHLLSTHDVQAEFEFCACDDSKQAFPPPPLLLLEHANAVSAVATIPPTINAAFIIVYDLPWKHSRLARWRARPRLDGVGHGVTQ